MAWFDLYDGDKLVDRLWVESREERPAFVERIHPEDRQLAHEKTEAWLAGGDQFVEGMEMRVQRFTLRKSGRYVLEGT
jgi:hypothetical protein